MQNGIEVSFQHRRIQVTFKFQIKLDSVWTATTRKKKKMRLLNNNAPEMAIFFLNLTLIFYLDLDRWPWTWYQEKGLITRYTHVNMWNMKALTPTNQKI